jgi:hypothetical protein
VKKWGWFVAAATLASITGCYRVTTVDSAVQGGREHSEWESFFVFGLFGDAQIDVRNECDGAAAVVGRKDDVATALVSVVTLGIYTPTRVTVACDVRHDPAGSTSPPSEKAPRAVTAE